MQKRTIKQAAGYSRVSAADAQRAAWQVSRDVVTGRVVLSKDGAVVRKRTRVGSMKKSAKKR